MLSDREKAFCAEYISNGKNATDAWMKIKPKAKYSSARSYSAQLLKKPEIREEIDRLIEENTKGKILTMNQSLEILTEIALTSSDTLKIKAISEIAKISGFYDNSSNININHSIDNSLDKLSEEQLIELLEKLGDE